MQVRQVVVQKRRIVAVARLRFQLRRTERKRILFLVRVHIAVHDFSQRVPRGIPPVCFDKRLLGILVVPRLNVDGSGLESRQRVVAVFFLQCLQRFERVGIVSVVGICRSKQESRVLCASVLCSLAEERISLLCSLKRFLVILQAQAGNPVIVPDARIAFVHLKCAGKTLVGTGNVPGTGKHFPVFAQIREVVAACVYRRRVMFQRKALQLFVALEPAPPVEEQHVVVVVP